MRDEDVAECRERNTRGGELPRDAITTVHDVRDAIDHDHL